ncbi:response regulator transcription factor [uncultured Ferrimonas sp.]|uniref:response regulator transcription factor n=1 Tax=uncultured Ferrimonas sp. TaxID=432640 RepID=UPI002625BDDF|nr:response regulator transcription factor [uncultured Ferrimonas sp.]
MNRILLIEDDLELAQLVSHFLGKNGYQVSHLANGNRLSSLLAAQQFQLILCDVNLPGRDGFALLEQLRHQFEGPILMLTARGDEQDHIRGLQLGADDYLIKPISTALLLARLRRHLPSEPCLPLALKLQPQNQDACLGTHPLALTPTEYSLLALFVQHFEQVLSREYLFENSVGREYDGMARTIDGRIVRLRKKLEQVPRSPLQLKTVWGQGYRLSAKDVA